MGRRASTRPTLGPEGPRGDRVPGSTWVQKKTAERFYNTLCGATWLRARTDYKTVPMPPMQIKSGGPFLRLVHGLHANSTSIVSKSVGNFRLRRRPEIGPNCLTCFMNP